MAGNESPDSIEERLDAIYDGLGAADDCLVGVQDCIEHMGAVEDRLARVATKSWVLGSVLAGMGLAATIAATIALTAIKLFFP